MRIGMNVGHDVVKVGVEVGVAVMMVDSVADSVSMVTMAVVGRSVEWKRCLVYSSKRF